MTSSPPAYVEEAAVVAGFPAAYLARVLRRRLRADMRRDGLTHEQAAAVVTALRAIEQAAHRWQTRRVTAEPSKVDAGNTAVIGSMSTATAANRLGIGEAAVRKRLRTGALAGRKTAAGRWLVHLPQR